MLLGCMAILFLCYRTFRQHCPMHISFAVDICLVPERKNAALFVRYSPTCRFTHAHCLIRPPATVKMSCRVKVGNEFSSYEELLAAVHELEADQCVTYYKRDFRTVEGAKGRIRHDINPALKYYEIKFTCIKGGKKYSGKSTGQRPNQRFAF